MFLMSLIDINQLLYCAKPGEPWFWNMSEKLGHFAEEKFRTIGDCSVYSKTISYCAI